MSAIQKINQNGVTVILVEHDMKVVMGLCHQILVLNYGQMIALGAPSDIQRNEEVIKAYLGEDPDLAWTGQCPSELWANASPQRDSPLGEGWIDRRVVGPNAAGKTTTLKAITGLKPIASGEIYLRGQRIDQLDTSEVIRQGIALSPEGRRVFPDLTVLENLRLGAYLRNNRQEIREDIERVYGYFLALKRRERQISGTLSGGEQQMLAIGRALMAKPKYLLLDEPSLGLAPLVVKSIAEIIKQINGAGVSILLVEQNARMALRLAEYAYVLESGQVALEGKAEELLHNDYVRKAYLGG
jgi:branched-chain amino acid transport system ATP-binding protein